MGMNSGNGAAAKDPEEVVDINTTPLIDVMLVMLIMLIITIPVQTHAVKLNMPVSQTPPPPTQPDVVTIDVDFDGTATWTRRGSSEVLPDQHAMELHLAAAAQEAEQPEVHIRPDRLTRYRFVASVLASAQRLGVTKIGLVDKDDASE